MSWHITINLKSNQILTVLNLVAINQIYNYNEPIDLFASKDFEQYQLPIRNCNLAFLGDSVITLPLSDIFQIRFSKK
jgi:hypothetical protein